MTAEEITKFKLEYNALIRRRNNAMAYYKEYEKIIIRLNAVYNKLLKELKEITREEIEHGFNI